MVAHTVIPATPEAEGGVSQVQGQPGLYEKTLSLKKKKKKKAMQ
jgi:hypothetical protein